MSVRSLCISANKPGFSVINIGFFPWRTAHRRRDATCLPLPTPVWSPRGDYIAFTKIKDGVFHIGVMRPDGSGERLITNGFLVEGPTWAPNGRVLAFFKQTKWDNNGRGGGVRLYSIDLTGHNELVFPTKEDASSPSWSPRPLKNK